MSTTPPASSSDDREISEETVPLDLDGDAVDETVIRQDVVGEETVIGQGEYPDPDTPPTGPSPGTDPARRAEIQRSRDGEPFADDAARPEGPSGQAQAVGTDGDVGPARTAATDHGNADDYDPPQSFKDVLDQDPDRWGSSTLPADDPDLPEPAAGTADDSSARDEAAAPEA